MLLVFALSLLVYYLIFCSCSKLHASIGFLYIFTSFYKILYCIYTCYQILSILPLLIVSCFLFPVILRCVRFSKLFLFFVMVNHYRIILQILAQSPKREGKRDKQQQPLKKENRFELFHFPPC